MAGVAPVGVGGDLEAPEAGWNGGIAGRALEPREEAKPRGTSPPVEVAGDDGLLALAGGRPVGVEGGALFLPFLGGVVDMRRCFEAVDDGVERSS